MIKGNNFKYKFIFLFFIPTLVLASEITWFPLNPKISDNVTIQYTLSLDDPFFYTYPLYIHIQENGSIKSRMMSADYASGESRRYYSFNINKFSGLVSDNYKFDHLV